MKKLGVFIFSAVMLFLIGGCGSAATNTKETSPSALEAVRTQQAALTEEMAMQDAELEVMPAKLKITVGGREFVALLEDSPAAWALAEKLPLQITMTELNGNEKYYRFQEKFPTQDRSPKQIRTGDLMLYDGNTLVLFYRDFDTSYQYTPLGRIKNAADLAEAVGNGDVSVVVENYHIEKSSN